jgi:geranylgeranyl pyrophosphate synthase
VDATALGDLLGVPDLPARLALVEARLDAALTADDAGFATALRRVAGSGGKRLRPALTVACAELFGTWDDRVVDAAAAVELVQVGSLVHDDILDGATTRRGVATINAREGPTPALLAGDVLLARAGELASGVSAEAAALVAASVADLCVGQYLEMSDAFDVDRTVERHLRSVRGKTAALFECACRLGAVCAGVGPTEAGALGRYGDAFGMAFQVLDDVLDVVGDPDRLGKPVGVDVTAGVYTLPVLHALAGPDGADLARVLRRRAAGDAVAARSLVQRAGGVAVATGVVHGYTDDAAAALGPLGDGAVVEGLRAFPRTYVGWALERFTADPIGSSFLPV